MHFALLDRREDSSFDIKTKNSLLANYVGYKLLDKDITTNEKLE